MDKTATNIIPRPPIVVIMGHIDHGKSTLLDYIRKTNIVDQEEGGITQHVRAYEVEVKVPGNDGEEKRKITFIDTPGHEAFCSIRERGSRVADIAILVISAEDGIKPQTLEALKCIKADNTPFIVAINKIDKNRNGVEKIKQNLAENEVLVEGWGGTVPIVLVSGKTGENIPELLEIISLQAELEELKADTKKSAEGFVIESSLSPKQGISSTLVIKNGTLRTGDFLATKGAFAPVRNIENFKGDSLKEATVSSPIRITGWDKIPVVGEAFYAFKSKNDAADFVASNREEVEKNSQDQEDERKQLTLIVKADTLGSLEAIEYELKKLGNDRLVPKIVSKGVGEINEGDVKNAMIKHSTVLGFNIHKNRAADFLALREKVEVKDFKIIYELLDFVKEKIKQETPVSQEESITGVAKILRTFSRNKDKQVIGGKMEEGEIKMGNTIKIERRGNIVGDGKIKEMQSQKIKTSLVREGDEFGVMIESKIDLVPGDLLKAVSLITRE